MSFTTIDTHKHQQEEEQSLHKNVLDRDNLQ